jgi:RIO kinase 2
MESTKAGQSDSENESEEEEVDEEDESERAEVEGEDEDVGSSEKVSEHEEEEPGGSAKSRRADAEEQTGESGRSRERPGSVSPSPVEQLASRVERALSVKEKEMRDKAATEVHKRRAREKQKYHSRRGTERIGRAKGSKAKQDNRVLLDKGGLWE